MDFQALAFLPTWLLALLTGALLTYVGQFPATIDAPPPPPPPTIIYVIETITKTIELETNTLNSTTTAPRLTFAGYDFTTVTLIFFFTCFIISCMCLFYYLASTEFGTIIASTTHDCDDYLDERYTGTTSDSAVEIEQHADRPDKYSRMLDRIDEIAGEVKILATEYSIVKLTSSCTVCAGTQTDEPALPHLSVEIPEYASISTAPTPYAISPPKTASLPTPQHLSIEIPEYATISTAPTTYAIPTTRNASTQAPPPPPTPSKPSFGAGNIAPQFTFDTGISLGSNMPLNPVPPPTKLNLSNTGLGDPATSNFNFGATVHEFGKVHSGEGSYRIGQASLIEPKSSPYDINETVPAGPAASPTADHPDADGNDHAGSASDGEEENEQDDTGPAEDGKKKRRGKRGTKSHAQKLQYEARRKLRKKGLLPPPS
jgi:hypothetical protein